MNFRVLFEQKKEESPYPNAAKRAKEREKEEIEYEEEEEEENDYKQTNTPKKNSPREKEFE